MGQGRRQFLVVGVLAIASLAHAQTARPAKRLGILSPHPKSMTPQGAQNPFHAVMTRRGWKAGQNLLVEYPDAGGREDRLPELAALLVEKKVDVIWANGPEAAFAAARATRTIPIVFWGVMHPVELGLIDSLARPGRNVTGVAFTADQESDAKRLQLLRELAPAVRRLAFVSTPSVRPGAPRIAAEAMSGAARALGFELREFRVATAEDLQAAFGEISAWGAQAIVAQPSTFLFRERARIIEFSNRGRLPSVFSLPAYVESGGLLSYAIDWRPTARARTNMSTASCAGRIRRSCRSSCRPITFWRSTCAPLARSASACRRPSSSAPTG